MDFTIIGPALGVLGGLLTCVSALWDRNRDLAFWSAMAAIWASVVLVGLLK